MIRHLAASPTARASHAFSRRARARSALTATLALAPLWALLAAGAPGSWAGSWIVGAPAVLLGAGLAAWLPPSPAWRLSPMGALRFAGFFAVQSARGAVDVAGRALAPCLALSPGIVERPIALPPGPARVAMANAITLLPGTLAAEVADDRLVIHALDAGAPGLDAELARLEARVRDLFGLEPAR